MNPCSLCLWDIKARKLAPVESPPGCASAQFNGVKKLGGWEALSFSIDHLSLFEKR